jgi:hypothetical protein
MLYSVEYPPKQYDGISCGVFVCKYMYELAIKKKLTDNKPNSYINWFRRIIALFVENGLEKFDQIVSI